MAGLSRLIYQDPKASIAIVSRAHAWKRSVILSEPFLSRAGKANGRFIAVLSKPMAARPPASVAVLSTMAALSRPRTRPVAAIDKPAKWPDLHTQAADCRFHIVLHKQFISGQAEPFLYKPAAAQWPLCQGRPAPVAVLSRPVAVLSSQPRWPFYQQWPIYQGRPTPDGRFIKANGRFIKALQRRLETFWAT